MTDSRRSTSYNNDSADSEAREAQEWLSISRLAFQAGVSRNAVYEAITAKHITKIKQVGLVRFIHVSEVETMKKLKKSFRNQKPEQGAIHSDAKKARYILVRNSIRAIKEHYGNLDGLSDILLAKILLDDINKRVTFINKPTDYPLMEKLCAEYNTEYGNDF